MADNDDKVTTTTVDSTSPAVGHSAAVSSSSNARRGDDKTTRRNNNDSGDVDDLTSDTEEDGEQGIYVKMGRGDLEKTIRRIFQENLQSLEANLHRRYTNEVNNNKDEYHELTTMVESLSEKLDGVQKVVKQMRASRDDGLQKLDKVVDDMTVLEKKLKRGLDSQESLLSKQNDIVVNSQKIVQDTRSLMTKVKKDEEKSLADMKDMKVEEDKRVKAISDQASRLETLNKKSSELEERRREHFKNVPDLLEKMKGCQTKADDELSKLERLSKKQEERIDADLTKQAKTTEELVQAQSSNVQMSVTLATLVNKSLSVVSTLESLDKSGKDKLKEISELQEKEGDLIQASKKLCEEERVALDIFKQESADFLSEAKSASSDLLEGAKTLLSGLEEDVKKQMDVLDRCHVIRNGIADSLLILDEKNEKLEVLTTKGQELVDDIQSRNTSLMESCNASLNNAEMSKTVRDSLMRMMIAEKEKLAMFDECQKRAEMSLNLMAEVEANSTKNYALGTQLNQEALQVVGNVATLQTNTINIMNKVTDEAKQREEFIRGMIQETVARYNLLYQRLSTVEASQQEDCKELKWKVFELSNEMTQLIHNAAKQSQEGIGVLRLMLEKMDLFPLTNSMLTLTESQSELSESFAAMYETQKVTIQEVKDLLSATHQDVVGTLGEEARTSYQLLSIKGH